MRVAMSVHTGLNSLTLYTWGTEEQKQKYLVPQAKGEKLATYGLTEPGAGSDVVGSRSTARREGDEYILNGEKIEGFKIAMFALEQGRFTVAAGATGVIRASRDASVAYANERETFGTKIANHQLVKKKTADMEAASQMSRLLWLRAAG